MDQKIQSVLDKINHLWEMQDMMMQEDRDFVPADERVIPIGPEAGAFIRDLIIKRGATRVLEIGTSHGYSTLYLADGLRHNESLYFVDAATKNNVSVITIEKNEKKISFATKNFEEAKVTNVITLMKGDARTILPTLEGWFDLIFIDARKDQYIDYFELVKDKIRHSGFIIADNINKPESHVHLMKEYQKHVRSNEKFKSHTENIGSGLEVSQRIS